MAVSGILIQLFGEALRWCRLSMRSTRSLKAENLFLRRQLALYIERGAKPRRVDPASRVSLALLARFFDWREALVVVRPETLIRWHRAGWRLFWRLKSRPGRPHMALGPGVPDPPSATPTTIRSNSRHRRGERYGVRAKSILGGLHHKYAIEAIAA